MSDAADRAAEVMIEHTRTRIEGCHCGWSRLGASHAEHVAQALADAGLLPTEWQVAECDDEVYEGHCHDELHANFEMEKLESVRTEVRKGVYEYRDLRPRRLVGPWVWPK